MTNRYYYAIVTHDIYDLMKTTTDWYLPGDPLTPHNLDYIKETNDGALSTHSNDTHMTYIYRYVADHEEDIYDVISKKRPYVLVVWPDKQTVRAGDLFRKITVKDAEYLTQFEHVFEPFKPKIKQRRNHSRNGWGRRTLRHRRMYSPIQYERLDDKIADSEYDAIFDDHITYDAVENNVKRIRTKIKNAKFGFFDNRRNNRCWKDQSKKKYQYN